MAHGNRIGLEDVPDHRPAACEEPPAGVPGSGLMADLEHQAIADAPRKSGGNKVGAARWLGIGLRPL